MKEKISYRVENWKQYNQALKNRGNIFVWFTDDVFKRPANQYSPKGGRPQEFSTGFIEMALAIRYYFHLPLRATEGFLNGLFEMQGLNVRSCDYTLLSKRAPDVSVKLKQATRSEEIIHLVVDSTGLKVFGDGEWKTRLYGPEKRRTWRKLHLAIDAQTHRIVGNLLTANTVADGSVLEKILEPVKSIDKSYMDGAYDQMQCYEAIVRRGGRAIIPPRSTSTTHKVVWSIPEQMRMLNVQGCELVGSGSWKVGMGYHRRSLAETAMGRWKRTFGGDLRSQKMENQICESQIKVKILNRMTDLGMPRTRKEIRWVR